AGYTPRTSKDAVNPGNPFGYVRQTQIAVTVDPALDIAVSDMEAPARPADDDLGRPLDEVKGRRRSR
ncbi:MAG: hypothetical protein GVY16_08875, partial [Planctomycetes bacterium]|nr:hypothetical protein [Planctomycetota bacterium]